jgi:hypothetical protein
MRLQVFGESDHLSNKEAAYATRWFARHLLGPRLYRVVWIRLQLVPGEVIKGDLANVMAYRGSFRFPRKFRINVNVTDQKRKGQLKGLAHEMVHVKQYAKGEVYDFKRRKEVTRWKRDIIDCRETRYSDWPWENEAWDLENTLYRLYSEHVKGAKF